MRTGTKDDQPLRFPGQERLFDGATGTEERYNVFRWYRSSWANYTQSDPVGLHRAGGVEPLNHIFSYADDDPVRRIDELGLRVATEGCTPERDAAIQTAAGNAEAAAVSCAGCKNNKSDDWANGIDAGSFKWVIRNSTYRCASAKNSGSACASATDATLQSTGKDVLLFPRSFDEQGLNQCGCLAGTILHEAFHNLIDREGAKEDYIYKRTKRCLSCARNP